MPYSPRDTINVAIRRFDWAAENFRCLIPKMAAYLRSGDIRIERTVRDHNGAKYVDFRLLVDRDIPDEFRFALGDVIHQLRSPLDNVTNAIARHFAMKNIGKLGFPVFLEESDFDRWTERYPFPPQQLRHFAAFQPFRETQRLGPNGSVEFRAQGKAHPFYILNKLSNLDKHNVPITVCGIQPFASVGTANGPAMRSGSSGGVAITSKGVVSITNDGVKEIVHESEVKAGGPIKHGDCYASIRLASGQTPESIEAQIGIDIALDTDSPAAVGQPIVPLVMEMLSSSKSAAEMLTATI